MEELCAILAAHAARYPRMQPQDAVKLIYQNEFGGGHLIRDEAQCLAYLLKEYRQTPQIAGVHPAEAIGNGMVRVHLNALDAAGYTPEQLSADFIRSAQIQTGTLDSFLQKLQLLRCLTAEGLLPFSSEALDTYLADYEKANYPMVSHSEEYRAAYSPAYRILRQECLSEETF